MRQFAVIGLGRFGVNVAKTLSQKGYQVLAVDIDEDRVEDISAIATQAVCTDATDIKALKAIGIEATDIVIVSVGDNIEASILITLALKQIGAREVIAKAVSEEHREILEKIGANRVVFPEKEMGIKLADSLIEG